MGKLKDTLPDGYGEDTFTLEPVTPEPEPSASEWAMWDLVSAVGILEENTPFGESDELDKVIARLMTIKARVDKPF